MEDNELVRHLQKAIEMISNEHLRISRNMKDADNPLSSKKGAMQAFDHFLTGLNKITTFGGVNMPGDTVQSKLNNFYDS